MTDSNPATLEGHLSIRAAIESSSRDIYTIHIDPKKQYERDLVQLSRLAEAHHIPVRLTSREAIDTRAGGSTHGGVIAEVGLRRFSALDDLLAENALVVMLDGIEDPFNFAQAVRSLYAAGIDSIVLRPRNWTSAAGVVGRASAGTAERIKMAVAETAEDAATFYRKQGLIIACTDRRENAISIYQADLTQPLFLLLGGEKRGITRSFVEQANLLLKIPYGRQTDISLGVVGAASVLGFEILRQRHIHLK